MWDPERKYMTHSIITKLSSVLMKRFFFKFWGPFLSSTDSSPDENGPLFPGFTQIMTWKDCDGLYTEKNILLKYALFLCCFHLETILKG